MLFSAVPGKQRRENFFINELRVEAHTSLLLLGRKLTQFCR